jgi:hypothetical protein
LQTLSRVFGDLHKLQSANLARAIRPPHFYGGFDGFAFQARQRESQTQPLALPDGSNALKAQSAFADVDEHSAIVGAEIDVRQAIEPPAHKEPPIIGL